MWNQFDRICLLNPAARVPGRQHALAQFDQLGLPVDCDRVRLVAIGEGQGDSLSAGQWRQCATHSALVALRQARADGLRQVVLVHDDAVFAPDAQRAAAAGPADNDPDAPWDVLLLGHGDAWPGDAVDSGRWVHQPVAAPDCVVVRGSAFEPLIADLEARLAPGGRASGEPEPSAFADVAAVMGAVAQRHPALRVWAAAPSITVPPDHRPRRATAGATGLATRWAGGA